MMTLEEHLLCCMEDLNNENILENADNTKLMIEKARAVSELVTAYNEIQNTKLKQKSLVFDAIRLSDKVGMTPSEMSEQLGLTFKDGK